MKTILRSMIALIVLCGISNAQSVSISGTNGGSRSASFSGTQVGSTLTGTFDYGINGNSVTFSDLNFNLLPEEPGAFPGNRYRAKFTLSQSDAPSLDIPWNSANPPEMIVNVRVNGTNDHSGSCGSPGNGGTLTPMR